MCVPCVYGDRMEEPAYESRLGSCICSHAVREACPHEKMGRIVCYFARDAARAIEVRIWTPADVVPFPPALTLDWNSPPRKQVATNDRLPDF